MRAARCPSLKELLASEQKLQATFSRWGKWSGAARNKPRQTAKILNMMSAHKLKEKVARVPQSPGVYIFKDAKGAILYIGKAKSLKKRVSSYFNRSLDYKNQVMVAKIADLEYRTTDSDSAAQVLEAILVKEHQPQYNIDLKDDKSFPWIRFTHEEYPAVSIYRKKGLQKGDKSSYLGPYTSVKTLRLALKTVRRIFGFRSCKHMPEEACLYYRLGLCPAPCEKKISAAKYREIIKEIRMFLESRYEELINALSDKMKEAAKEKNFEEAARMRDQISALSAFSHTPSAPLVVNELEELRDLLKLDKLPLRIEAFDISNISGKEATGSMVSFYRGLADKNNYRRFRIKTVSAIDDYGMLREVIQRRYTRLVREHLPLPDLVLIDGGKGHLMAAAKEISSLNISIPLGSIAKDRENIYSQDRAHPLRLREGSLALNLIRRIRDEAHRFAISYHHLLHRKKVIGR